MNRIQASVLLAGTLCVTLVAVAGPVNELSLDEAITIALRENPGLAAVYRSGGEFPGRRGGSTNV